MHTTIEYIKKYIDILHEDKSDQLKQLLSEVPTSELAQEWGYFDETEQVHIFMNLDIDNKVDLIHTLSYTDQERLIEVLSVEHTKLLLAEMAPDDLADFIQSISPDVRKAVWQNLSEDAKKEALFLLKFDEDDAAGLMTPRYLALRSGITVANALQFIRKNSENVETVYYVYVIDQLKRLMGVVSLRQILSSRDDEIIENIMEKKVVFVHEQTDQEEVAKILETWDLLALPVVDTYNRLLGIITVDDVIDVIRQEQTEDMYKMGAMDGKIDRYVDTSLLGLVRKRIPWLIVLLLLGTVTTNVLHHYEPLVLSAAFLFIFIPVITQTGGNSGNQSTTLMIRGLATGELRFRDIGKVIGRELLIGLLLGIGTGIVIIGRSMLLPPAISIFQAMTVGLALAFVVLFSNIIGAIAPLVISRLGFDPTVMSAPLMATLIDVVGLTIYFETARLLLRL
jgi:magnesium transporter